jgi:hypothetical protein
MSVKNEVPHNAGPHLAYETIAPLLMMQYLKYFDTDLTIQIWVPYFRFQNFYCNILLFILFLQPLVLFFALIAPQHISYEAPILV